jgi:hypothetical protein
LYRFDENHTPVDPKNSMSPSTSNMKKIIPIMRKLKNSQRRKNT